MDRYKKTINIVGGTMSEKFDGIQGVWDGKVLRSRTDHVLPAPAWWLKELPKVPVIGELWTKRNDFSNIQSIVTTQDGSGNWESIKFMVFSNCKFINLGKYGREVLKFKIYSQTLFDQFYKDILHYKGEGIVITVDGIDYKRKPKTYDDGKIISYTPGTGKYLGMTGALVIKLRDGRTMKLSGMNDSLRQNPPAIGTIIEFSHWGRTSTGLPRFAAFDRVRMETNLNF